MTQAASEHLEESLGNSVRSSRIRPLSWSTSYLFRLPRGISIRTSNSMAVSQVPAALDGQDLVAPVLDHRQPGVPEDLLDGVVTADACAAEYLQRVAGDLERRLGAGDLGRHGGLQRGHRLGEVVQHR